MARFSDGKKVSTWRRRFRRYSRSGLTVAEFCSREGVSEPSFYYWKQKFGVNGSRRRRRIPAAKPAFQALSVVGRTPVMSARLPSGVQLDVCVADTQLLRSVVTALLRADGATDGADVPC